jgi:tRNA threonylcarbamoyladenosine biosynthesis protein TsaB
VEKNLQGSARMNEMVTVVVETSTPQGSVGLWDGAWQEKNFVSERSHNCAVFAPLEELLESMGGRRIEQVLVGTGPGSYSGTRVGIAVAQGLAIAHGAAMIGLPSVCAVPLARMRSHCRAVGDARRGDWWWWEVMDGRCADEPQMGSKDELAALLADGVEIFSLDPVAEEEFGRKVAREIPCAGLLWQAWQQLSSEEREKSAAQIVQPVYLKPPHITMAKPGHPLLRSVKSPPA